MAAVESAFGTTVGAVRCGQGAAAVTVLRAGSYTIPAELGAHVGHCLALATISHTILTATRSPCAGCPS